MQPYSHITAVRAAFLSAALSLFPLVASLALSLSKLAFRKGGVDLQFIGFAMALGGVLLARSRTAG